jgi:hypothetical protein
MGLWMVGILFHHAWVSGQVLNYIKHRSMHGQIGYNRVKLKLWVKKAAGKLNFGRFFGNLQIHYELDRVRIFFLAAFLSCTMHHQLYFQLH